MLCKLNEYKSSLVGFQALGFGAPSPVSVASPPPQLFFKKKSLCVVFSVFFRTKTERKEPQRSRSPSDSIMSPDLAGSKQCEWSYPIKISVFLFCSFS